MHLKHDELFEKNPLMFGDLLKIEIGSQL